MASQTRWTWVWVNSGRWWWTGRPGVLQFMGSQRVGHDWATELNWTETVIWLKIKERSVFWNLTLVRRMEISSVQFSCSVVSDSLWPHGLQHPRPPCPSPSPGACSNSCPLSGWCHPTISSSVFLFCLQSFPASGSFQMSEFFTSGVQSIRVSASASVLPMNIQDWFPLGWNGLNPCSPRDSQESSPTAQSKSISASVLNLLYGTALTSMPDYWKNHSFE